ncbi:MAG: uracil-DNA glycosylase [Hyphomonadaceae bacterium]|nr:uracil-DNA glycosylase [Hyphomonadaceae bacterium]MBC6412413.1 uracil-DNA glycosylase [Hyphomonadaceae bacterium]
MTTRQLIRRHYEPPPDCDRCPRLHGFLQDLKTGYPDYHNAPVPSFGDPDPKLLIVGLAPGLHGANRTGRPFTGDWAGDLLYGTLNKFGFSEGTYDARADDGLRLKGAMITNAVRCLPPANTPLGAECTNCRQFLKQQIRALTSIKAILTLGGISHDNTVKALDLKLKNYPFGHHKIHELQNDRRLYSSYHCSRYNTNTGRLTTDMFEAVFADIRAYAAP